MWRLKYRHKVRIVNGQKSAQVGNHQKRADHKATCRRGRGYRSSSLFKTQQVIDETFYLGFGIKGVLIPVALS